MLNDRCHCQLPEIVFNAQLLALQECSIFCLNELLDKVLKAKPADMLIMFFLSSFDKNAVVFHKRTYI